MPWAVSIRSFSSSGVPKREQTREEVADVVAERSVVRVLLDRHELDGVVAELRDARQDVRR